MNRPKIVSRTALFYLSIPILCIFFAASCKRGQPAEGAAAQLSTTPKDTNSVQKDEPILAPDGKSYIKVEVMPEYPGGERALIEYISKSVNYPADAKSSSISGMVICQFVVGIDGKVQDIQVVSSLYPSLDAEALRVVGGMDTWTPGKQGGQPVSVLYSIPIRFKPK